LVKSSGYLLDIRWSTDSKGDFITLKTTSDALNGYRNNTYTCTYKENILKEVDKCIDSDDKELDSQTYISVINKSMYELNGFISSSGYNKEALLKDHEWLKK
jgi:hypothetical protein